MKKIFAILGESGSGKTMIAEAVKKDLGINMIESYTDRPKRTPTEVGHTFLTKEQYDELDKEQMIAFTEWNGYRYCCLTSDVEDVNTYVIDEAGLDYLEQYWGWKYDIYSIRVHRDFKKRLDAVGLTRTNRDFGKFLKPNWAFNHVVYNRTENKQDVIKSVEDYIIGILEEVL